MDPETKEAILILIDSIETLADLVERLGEPAGVAVFELRKLEEKLREVQG